MTMNAYAIPLELRQLNCWLLWKFVATDGPKPTKVPFQTNGNKASVTDPANWTDFDTAFNALQIGGYDGLGFVFDNSHPYSFVDLDDTDGNSEALQRQINVFNEFDSYSEISPSGKGLHIIVKGKVPAGRRRSSIEIYSHERYATMTGNIYADKPIADRNDLLNQLWKQMDDKPKTISIAVDQPQSQDDADIIKMATDAVNGEKFLELYQGDWRKVYPVISAAGGGPSEADQSLINIITFYTKNKEQIARIFKASVLGKRDKITKNKNYLPKMIDNSFDQTPPHVDFQNYKDNIEDQLGSVAQRSEPAAHNGLVAGSSPATSTIQPPSGLVGEIAAFIYEAAPRQVPEVALAAALGLMAGICGRSYNISGTGLNQYILLLAMTGTGKESLASGIDRLLNEVQLRVPVASEFLGPSEIASGQALVKYLSKQSQCFVSILGEFGLRLRAMASQNANSAEISLRRMLLDLYNKSGHGQVARPSIYADTDKNTSLISSPSFSILGESTPERFYDILNEEMITEGLLPRFMLIEYNGRRPSLNPNHLSAKPSMMLIQKVADLMTQSKTIMANRSVCNIAISPDALKMLNEFDVLADDKINSADKEILRHLWNRAHIKVLKIAGLIAVGNNFFHPEVQVDEVIWAKNIVVNDINSLSSKFEEGKIGKTSDELKQQHEIFKKIKIFLEHPYEKVKSYVPNQMYHSYKIVPYAYLSRRLVGVKCFDNGRGTGTDNLKKSIQNLIDMDIIREVGKIELDKKFSSRERAFTVTDISRLE